MSREMIIRTPKLLYKSDEQWGSIGNNGQRIWHKRLVISIKLFRGRSRIFIIRINIFNLNKFSHSNWINWLHNNLLGRTITRDKTNRGSGSIRYLKRDGGLNLNLNRLLHRVFHDLIWHILLSHLSIPFSPLIISRRDPVASWRNRPHKELRVWVTIVRFR
jgi:hypothetical protein